MRSGDQLKAWMVMLICLAAVTLASPAAAQMKTSFDRPGGDYLRAPVPSGDPKVCARLCEHDHRCRAWSFHYPTVKAGATCHLKNSVPPRVASDCCVSGVRGGGVVEPKSRQYEISIDRAGGDYHSFVMRRGGAVGCRSACLADTKCRAWTYARAGYVGREPHCFLKKEIKPPRRRAGFISGVVR
jgi:hypothetical protein